MKGLERTSYFEDLEKKINGFFTGTEQQVAKIILKVSNSPYDTKRVYITKLRAAFLSQESWKDEDFFEPLLEFARVLLGQEYGAFFRYFVDHLYEYPYSHGYFRRPFRTTNVLCHFDRVLNALSNLLELHMTGFSVEKYFANHNDKWWYNPLISDWIAYEFDCGNVHVTESLKGIIFGENNTSLLSNQMIKGIVKCHQKENYQMLGDLLVAARLQEGLRQSIVESMDEGTPEATIYLLKIILDHDLIRYSSVLRALAVWTGLDLEAANKRVAKQMVEAVFENLMNHQLRSLGLTSQNSNTLYTSLWATAFYEEEDVRQPIIGLMQNGADYQKITAQFFLSQSQNRSMKFDLSHPYLNQSTLELNFYLLQNYELGYERVWSNTDRNEVILAIEKIPLLESKIARNNHFELFKQMLLRMPKNEIAFESMHFKGQTILFSADEIVKKIMYLQLYDNDRDMLKQMLDWKNRVSSSIRETLLTYFIKDFSDTTQREFLFVSLVDRSMTVRETALSIVSSLELFPEEIEKIEELLRLKTGSLRQTAIQILLGLPVVKLETTIERLLDSRIELKRLAALDLLAEIKNDPVKGKLFTQAMTRVAQIKKATPKERILIDKLLQTNEYLPENGFGLFDPNKVTEFEISLPKIKLKDFLTLPSERVIQIVQGMADIIHENRHFEYEAEDYDGSKITLHVGEDLRKRFFQERAEKPASELDYYPLSTVWTEYFAQCKMTDAELVQVMFYLHSNQLHRYFFGLMLDWELRRFLPLKGWWRTFLEEIFLFDKIDESNRYFEEMDYNVPVKELFDAYFFGRDGKGIFKEVVGVLNDLFHSIPEDKKSSQNKILEFLTEPWLKWCEVFSKDDESFVQYFKLKYQLCASSQYDDFHPSLEEFARAHELGLIEVEIIFQELFSREDQSRYYLAELTDPKNDICEKYPFMMFVKNLAVQRILEIELNRGDLPTPVSHLAVGIQRFEGMERFVKLLSALEKETFVRGDLYLYGKNITKKEVMSFLLKNCYPEQEEDAEKLKFLLNGKHVSEQKLLEAAVYATQWLEFVEEYLGWDGLQSSAWYFHAHVNEFFPAEKEAKIARYSPISSKDFQDGAFDIHWFKECYEQLGDARFEMIYQCAKYITGGANHRRSQLFADAVIGKSSLEETKKAVQEKRNKDQLLSYSLIPIENEEDVLDRYEYLQQFLKESKKFGSQRRASEAKTVDIALENLARNAGFQDITRLKWAMEAKKMENIKPFLEPIVIEDVTVQLIIHETGEADLVVFKDEKQLKSLPARLNKNETIVTLKALKADLKEQYKRGKVELERSMVQENGFSLKEIITMMNNPVLAPLISRLVLKAGNRVGFFNDGKLQSANFGESYSLLPDEPLFIAHPLHLFERGEWSAFQRDLFLRKVKQPFKQVFRELYLPNQEELDSVVGTRRYAGHQIQAKKSVALLKSRLWTVSHEEGLQKVFYKENIIVELYAMADWFSPSDVESPTLEAVKFFDRHTYKPKKIEEIPKLIFSETMRDIDLVVSAAHVGGVDPEASLITLEMRRAIVAESIRLLQLENVKLDGNFALIEGKLGEYSVHLGSANVYKQATGALFIVPVHSQHRGRIFLPFMDEDPKTAEIVSKILLLAQDQKIKDPYILQQL